MKTIILATNDPPKPEEHNADDRYNYRHILTAQQANSECSMWGKRMRKEDFKRLRERMKELDILYHWNHRKYYRKDDWPEDPGKQ